MEKYTILLKLMVKDFLFKVNFLIITILGVEPVQMQGNTVQMQCINLKIRSNKINRHYER